MLRKIFQYILENHLLVNMILIIILAIGLFSTSKMRKEAFPTTELNRMLVSVIYPGASPLDVERNAVIPIEEELEQISSITDYTSLAMENGARIQITLDDKADNVQTVKDEIYRKLSNVPDLPDEVKEVLITDMNPKLMAVYSLGIHLKTGVSQGKKELYDFVDQLESQLRKLSNVSQIRKEGYVDPEIHIYVDPNKAQEKYISLTEVVNSIQAQNVRSTGGTLQSLQKEQAIVTIGQFTDPLEVGEVIIRSNFSAKRIYIKDIANVVAGFEKQDVAVRINQTEGVVLSIVKKSNADIIQTVDQVKKFIKKNKQFFPDYLDIIKIQDTSLSIRSLLQVVITNLIIGFLLVFIILLIFLDKNSAIWTAMGIPVVFMLAMIYMFATNLTFNIISLGALIMLLGIVVDDGIVVSENIYHFRQKGQSGIDATISGLKEVISPVSVAIVTTIVAFLPMLFISGMMGKMIREFPIVVIIALAASLFEALLILPSHLVFSKRKNFANQKENWFTPFSEKYSKLLSRILKHRYLALLLSIGILSFTILLFSDGIKNFVLMTDDSSDQIMLNLELPDGSSRKKTIVAAAEIEKIILKQTTDKERLAIQTSIGHHNERPINTEGYHDNWGQIKLVLVPSNDRERNADQIISAIRQALSPELKKQFILLEVKKVVMGPDVGKGVEIKIIGNNENLSKTCSDEIKQILTNIPGVIDIEDDFDTKLDELHVVFDQIKMARTGLNVATIANTIRTAYEGTVATYVQTNTKRYDFRVEIDPKFKVSQNFLLNLLVPNKKGNMIRLKEIAHLEKTENSATLNRYNGERTITITADIDKTKNSSKKIMMDLKKKLAKNIDKYNTLTIQFSGEMEETMSSLKDLFISFGFAIMAIYCILVLLFRSPWQPFLILGVLPFGLIGAFIAFFLHSLPLSFMGMIGIIGLCGVLVNDSVIMVDFINKVIQNSPTAVTKQVVIENIIQGAKRRLRPVILTTITTVAGLLPTIYGIGGSSEMIRPLVIALGYGILFGTIITLLILPVLYLISWDSGLIKILPKTKNNFSNHQLDTSN